MNKLLNREMELSALCEMSGRLGGNPFLAQASSGNTSVKIEDSLWIKASGRWLIHADAGDFLIEVGLARAQRCVREDVPIPETRTQRTRGISASIETAMHAALPHKVVAHLHSVAAIAWAVRHDAPEQLAARLAGLPWLWIPYTPSGNPLANAISSRLSEAGPADVFVLGNHGLVVCGDSCRSVELLLDEVERRLLTAPRVSQSIDIDSLAANVEGSQWFVPPTAEIQMLATDPMSREILAGGVLYPCQAIFLPDSLSIFSQPLRSDYLERGSTQQIFRILNGYGVICHRSITPAEQQMLSGLARVVNRIPEPAALRYLSPGELDDVMSGGAASYRDVVNASSSLIPAAQPV